MVSSLTDASWLLQIERLLAKPAGKARGGGLLPSRFRCRLEDQPHHLVPQHYLQDWAGEDYADAHLFLNLSACFAHDEEIPPHRPGLASLVADFAQEGDIVWITDPDCGALQPFWLERDLAATLAAVRPGDPAPSGLAPRTRRILALAGVLVPTGWVASRRSQWNAVVARCVAQFQKKGYAPVARLIHPFHVAELRRHYRYLLRTGQMPLDDGQCSRRHVAHNDGAARFFHLQFTAAVSALVGEAVKPSYVYVATYREGAHLERHVDREQCDFSITFCLDYSPEPSRATPWPLHLDTPSAKVTVFQSIGDGLLYRGRELPHFRDTLPAGHSSTSIFFHYVREGFAGPLD